MVDRDGRHGVPTRRQVLKAGSLALLGAAVPRGLAKPVARAGGLARSKSCILLLLVGGPSHLDTFDPKPEAPAEVRGPFRPIRTNLRGTYVSELLPKTAAHADKYAIIRAMHHDAPPVHDAGYQSIQTGHYFGHGPARPHVAAACESLCGSQGTLPGHVLLPGPIGGTGGDMPHGQSGGMLGPAYNPLVLDPLAGSSDPAAAVRAAMDSSRESEILRQAYGPGRFGQSCLAARRLVERGVRFVTVNMFQATAGPTWDAHGSEPFTGIVAYRDGVAAAFDCAYATLLADLNSRGLLETTLVVAAGEFGRTPRINRAGGRDHWPECWSVLVAGGGVKGGQVIGRSDAIGAYPEDRPVTPAELVASIYHVMGVNPAATIAGPGVEPASLLPPGTQPIAELL